MGGRGSSSGMSDNGKPYGSEYSTVYEDGNIKFVTKNEGSSKAPLETMSGSKRIYATIGSNGEVRTVSFYDTKGKRIRQIDIDGQPHYIDGKPVLPHAHIGYTHDENGGTRELTDSERRLVERALASWEKHKKDEK